MSARKKSSKPPKDAAGRSFGASACSPLCRPVANGYWSHCNSHNLTDLDFDDWWMDSFSGIMRDFGKGIYLHVASAHDDTRHRVYPRAVKGRVAMRLGFDADGLHWIYDAENIKDHQ